MHHSTRRRFLAAMLAAPVLAPVALPTLETAAKGNGRKLARYARKFKGDRYRSASADPKRGFDCSGLTWYCVQKVYGMDIGRSVTSQWKFGKKVKKSGLRSGDLVFFVNTYERGLSHCGIYLGGGKFIHAESEKTGVIITRLDSDYYTEHYKGARRL
ncbi:MAG: C40 family peptidase [Thermomicrobiales bacterium]|nr:C40 family peptidase [Thermomicrobiales bacterium]